MPMIGRKSLKISIALPIDIFFAKASHCLYCFLAMDVLSRAIPTNKKVLWSGSLDRLPDLLESVQAIIHKEQKGRLEHEAKVTSPFSSPSNERYDLFHLSDSHRRQRRSRRPQTRLPT